MTSSIRWLMLANISELYIEMLCSIDVVCYLYVLQCML